MSYIPSSTTRSLLLLLFAVSAILSTPAVAENLHGGSWTKKSFAIAGGWSIVEEGGRHYVVLDDAFKTKKAPDLKLFLSKQELGATNGKNATKDAVLIAKLDSERGGQRYALPAVDLAEYRTLLIHCEKYLKLWGGAPLR